MLQYLKITTPELCDSIFDVRLKDYLPTGKTWDEVDLYISPETAIPDHDRQYTEIVQWQHLMPDGTFAFIVAVGQAGPNEYLVIGRYETALNFQIKLKDA